MYLDQPAQWDRLAERLSDPARWPLGVDTETFGQPDKTGPQYRARVQCWSIATQGEVRHPRGYRVAWGAVLPAAALEHAGLRALLERTDIPKLAHNAPHDYHALCNMGLDVRGLDDTLQWCRVALPGLWHGYGLKDLEVHVLGKQTRPDFKAVTRLDYTANVVRKARERACICGKSPCRARATSEWFDSELGWFRYHTRVSWRRFWAEPVEKTRQRDVSEMVPGCPGWDAWVAYALADAVSVLELADYLTNLRPKWGREAWPWSPRSGPRPSTTRT